MLGFFKKIAPVISETHKKLYDLSEFIGPVQARIAYNTGKLDERLYEETLKGKSNVKDLEKQGYKKVNTDDINIIDGDTYELNGKTYRLTGMDNNNAFFDAAETNFMVDEKPYGQGYNIVNSKIAKGSNNRITYNQDPEYINTSVDVAKNLLKTGKTAYVKDLGQEDKYGRGTSTIYYESPNTPNWYHAYDSAMVTKGEAVFGMQKNDNRMSDRQKNIVSKAKEFLYPSTPYQARQNPKALMFPTHKIKIPSKK